MYYSDKELLKKEGEVIVQLYSNDADVVKYLPLFFNSPKQLKAFINMFGGKTIKIPETYNDFVLKFIEPDKYIKNKKHKGINNIGKIRKKLIESYTKIFPSLYDCIKYECNKKWDD